MRKLTLISLVIALGLMTAAAPGFASTDPQPDAAAEQDLFASINHERTSRGLRALTWNARIGGIARDHSGDMARSGELHHNSDLASDVGSFSALAENVGTGGSVEAIHEAFMDSSGHRGNILGSFQQVGVGVMVDDNGMKWVTEVFYTPEQSSSTSSTQPSTSTTRKARPTTTGSTSGAARARVYAAAVRIREVRAPAVAPPVVVEEPGAVRTVGALEQLSDAYA